MNKEKTRKKMLSGETFFSVYHVCVYAHEGSCQWEKERKAFKRITKWLKVEFVFRHTFLSVFRFRIKGPEGWWGSSLHSVKLFNRSNWRSFSTVSYLAISNRCQGGHHSLYPFKLSIQCPTHRFWLPWFRSRCWNSLQAKLSLDRTC